MVRHLALANLYYLTLVLQPNMNVVWSDPAWCPWLPGIVLVVCVLFCNELAGVIWACVLGIGVDCLSIHRLGTHTVVATSLAVCLMLITFDHRPRGMLIYGFLTLIVTFLWLVLSAVMHGFLEAHAIDIASVTATASTRALSTAVLVQSVMFLISVLKFFVQSEKSTSFVLANRWAMLNGK